VLWSFGDGSSGSGVLTTHTYSAVGTYPVVLTVTDSGGLSATKTKIVTVASLPPPPPPTVHLGDLDGTSATGSNTWSASVRAFVHDAAHGSITGAAVSGYWSDNVAGSCSTGQAGYCNLSRMDVPRKVKLSFTVTSINVNGYSYDSYVNHDPDGDSTGWTITFARR
jgi:PKD repeat protein